ncbi:MAG: DUF1192 domain-containing protein [Alphaproteobacteria bacterium]|nr:DUF1192 domain-containing protein [Alphaproteobacteria bacterium]
MDLDDLEPRHSKKKAAPVNLQLMDIAELEDYIAELRAEIERAEAMIGSKKAVRSGADALFKKN